MITTEGSSACDKTCLNTDGSFECSCPKGWELIGGRNCIDVNECNLNPTLCQGGACINTEGGYLCRCPSGI